MEDDQQISRDKVIHEFDRRARLHGNMNAVLDAGEKPGIARQNILRDYLTRKRLMKALQPSETDEILDFGCGVGRLTAFLRPKVHHITGVDASESMIETARKIHDSVPEGDFLLISGLSLPFPDHYFDKAFSVWVMQHIGDDEMPVVAGEISRVLKPGGTLVLLEQTRKQRTVLCDIHIHRSAQDYEMIFEKAGLHIMKSKAAMRVPSYAMSYWNRFRSLSRGFLPLLDVLEKLTLHYKERNVDYYTWSFVYKKNIS
ncbi:MAG: class I SAM-dependent methyltransferase [Bacteroidales bacterium]